MMTAGGSRGPQDRLEINCFGEEARPINPRTRSARVFRTKFIPANPAKINQAL